MFLQFQTHPVMNFVIFQRNVILVYCVPFLDSQLFRPCTQLRSSKFFQIADTTRSIQPFRLIVEPNKYLAYFQAVWLVFLPSSFPLTVKSIHPCYFASSTERTPWSLRAVSTSTGSILVCSDSD